MSSIIHIDDSSDDEIPDASGFSAGSTSTSSAIKKSGIGTNARSQSIASATALLPSVVFSSLSKGGSLVSPTPAPNTKRKAEIATMQQQQKTPPKKKAKVSKPTKAFSLIWVGVHGRGQRRNWRKKDLKIVGIYPSKGAAEEAKRDIMDQHTCCGHGDILIGGMWDDEVDLVIREAPLHL